jgi:F-type H+-transporting ATPase subunit b
MLIDWFTVCAQALNFLILVWLLERFLYKPVRKAIDDRQKGIAATLAGAEAQKTAADKQRDDFAGKNKVFDEQRAALLAKAEGDAATEHDRLLEEARKEAETLRAVDAAALRNDQARMSTQIAHAASEEVIAVARRALADLATASLEERVGAVFTRRLGEMDGKAKETMSAAIRGSSEPAVVESAFDMPAAQRAAIQNALNEAFSADVRLQFRTAEDPICGIELTAGGQKIGWNIAGYLSALDDRLDALLQSQPVAR